MTVNTFNGSPSQQALAAEIFRLMTAQGVLFAADAPIRQTLTNLTDFLASRQQRTPDDVAKEIDAALQANEQVFTREEAEGQVTFVTSRLGAYVPRIEDTSHTFKQRLYEPENPLPIDDISVVVSTSRPALTTVEPVFISDYWQRQAGLMPVLPDGETEDGVEAPMIAADAEETAPVIEVAPVEEAALVEEVAPAVPATSSTVLTLADGLAIDLRRSVDELMAEHGAVLASRLSSAIDNDPLRRIVSFGRQYYLESALASMGKNDMRRIRDEIVEQGEPLLDTTLIANLYYHNPRQSDYEGFRFSLNYRLSREKDFEFVGVQGANLWSTKGLPTIGTKRVKASEMAQLAAYLEEGFDDSLEIQTAESIHETGSANRLLTFFEWEYGILPLDANLKALLPPPLLPDQRSAVLRVESPQHYTTYLVEVRYPTGNRGGWLQGLEEFFHEHLVPGALITLARTPEANVFTISYEEAPPTEDRLLTLDEKKNKLAFANITYYCAVDADQVVNQQRFGRLRNLKSFPMAERRKSEMMLEHVVETLGEPAGTREQPRVRFNVNDVVVGCNVLRPMSRSYILSLITNNDDFEADPANEGVYIFHAEVKDTRSSGDDDEEEDVVETRPMRRGGRYADDDDE
ncbi:MAG: hypothetical protein MUD01_19880 [Chloroflexaceae bacterium]|jgi:hypothetical protein|nr:hypothetical protein [Chloroflexaceae bacterium]